jgi:L,D-transpeptidase catalytic domain
MRKPGVAARALALAGVLLLVCHTASAQDSAMAEARHRTAPGGHADRVSLAGQNPAAASLARPIEWNRPLDQGLPTAWNSPWAIPVGFAFRPPIATLPVTPQGPSALLSDAELRVSEVAARNGDRNYLMVDKSRGKLIQFANGVPVFVSPALTGASLADRIPADAYTKTFAEQYDTRFRVTPAGRFTVSHGFDRVVGATLDINEIKGRDWSIAIHSAGSASRYARLRSSLDEDKHITEGCVNVDADTMRRLATLPARHGRIPLYILPMDEHLITQFF